MSSMESFLGCRIVLWMMVVGFLALVLLRRMMTIDQSRRHFHCFGHRQCWAMHFEYDRANTHTTVPFPEEEEHRTYRHHQRKYRLRLHLRSELRAEAHPSCYCEPCRRPMSRWDCMLSWCARWTCYYYLLLVMCIAVLCFLSACWCYLAGGVAMGWVRRQFVVVII